MSPLWFSSPSVLSRQNFIVQVPSPEPTVKTSPPDSPWLYSTIGLAIALIGLIIYGKFQIEQIKKEVKFEQFKSKDFKKKLKLALHTIKKMETNPDLVHSRAFNLDYLRMRMDEEVFHYVIVNQIKMKVTNLIGEALRPNTAKNAVGIVGAGRQINENFDVTYEVEAQEGKWNKGVLFRIQIKLTKLPTQTSSATVNEIINCIETFLSADSDQSNWQPAIHGQIVLMSWDQKAKPTPLLVLEQSEEGVNVSFRSHPLKAPAPSGSDAD
jgi:hypothetical protein